MPNLLKTRIKWYFITGILIVIVMLALFARGHFYDTVFGVLGWVKKASGREVDIEKVYQNNTQPPDHALWDELLKHHVSKDGWVNYRGFIRDSIKLRIYLNQLGEHPPSYNWSTEEELAYWVNTYNAFTIQLILNHYPVNGIKKISGSVPMINSPWDIKFFKIGEVLMDLNTIEHEILRKKIGDPRIHFAINCASVSCPVLRTEAFTAENVFTQLEEQAILFINDTTRNKVSSDLLELSPIFNWFRSDFEEGLDLTQYISNYANVEISPKSKIKWLEYNWALNEINQ